MQQMINMQPALQVAAWRDADGDAYETGLHIFFVSSLLFSQLHLIAFVLVCAVYIAC